MVVITRRVPRLWTSSPKNQQCHLIVSLSPFSWSLLPFNAKNLKLSCISHVDRMPTLLPTKSINKPRNECISNKKWMVWAEQVGQMIPNCTKNWGLSEIMVNYVFGCLVTSICCWPEDLIRRINQGAYTWLVTLEDTLHMIVHIALVRRWFSSWFETLKSWSSSAINKFCKYLCQLIKSVLSHFSVNFQFVTSQFVSFELSAFSHAFQFEFLTILAHMVRHLVYGVLNTSKELPSPIRLMLESVFAYCHKWSKILFSYHIRVPFWNFCHSTRSSCKNLVTEGWIRVSFTPFRNLPLAGSFQPCSVSIVHKVNDNMPSHQ